MTYDITKIFHEFDILFPEYSEIDSYFKTREKNAIRLKFKDHREFIFTYNGPDDWKLETLKMHERSKLNNV